MKIGIITDSYRLPMPESLRLAASAGADGVQCYATSALLSLDPSGLARDASSMGLEISALVAELGGHGFERAADNPRKLGQMEAVFDFAAAAGAGVVTGHIGVIPADPSHPRHGVMRDALDAVGRQAASRNLVFAVETGPEPPETLASMLAQTSSGVAVNYDPANLLMVHNTDPVHAVEVLHPWIAYTHAKDGVHYRDCDAQRVYDAFASGGFEQLQRETGDLFEEKPLGEGDVGFPRCLKALRRHGYGGYLTIERETGDNPVEEIAQAVKYLRALLEDAASLHQDPVVAIR